MADFLYNFQNHRRLSEQLLKPLSERRKKLPGEGHWKDFSKFGSDFIAETAAQYCENHQRSCKKY
jgi:hypothetical protein